MTLSMEVKPTSDPILTSLMSSLPNLDIIKISFALRTLVFAALGISSKYQKRELRFSNDVLILR